MAHRLLYDPDSDGWERSDFPIVCETCLGPNPYVRMQRIEYGGTCHISGRPYTVFRWRPGNEARYKKTIICQEVAKAKNVCQVCLLDLDHNLPVQVRDTAEGIEKDDIPQSDVIKEYKLEQMKQSGELGEQYLKMKPNETILRLQRTTPYYKRNLAPICSFFVRGECNRGTECPYRHEMPTTGDLAEQNIKDRYYGINDPVAIKMLKKIEEIPTLTPPDDKSITTLYIGGLPQGTAEDDLRDQFYSFGELTGLKVVEAKSCGFVTFAKRPDAEKAAKEMASQLTILGQRCKLMWGKPQTITNIDSSTSATAATNEAVSRQQQNSTGPNYFNLPISDETFLNTSSYPSMDPSAMGTYIPVPEHPASQKRPLEQHPEESVKKIKAMPPPTRPPPQAAANVQGLWFYPPPGFCVPLTRPPDLPHPIKNTTKANQPNTSAFSKS